MGLGSFIRKQFVDVIQWSDPNDETLMWRFPIQDEEIQNGASLVVRESQVALFVDEGKVADLFSAGTYTLNTKTLPVLTYLKNWDKFFESPFKSDIYFFNTRLQLARKWGTSQPITIRDREFGLVSVRAFGMYTYRLVDPAKFFLEVAGIVSEYSGVTLETQLRNLIVTSLSNLLGNANIPFIDLAANQIKLSEDIQNSLSEAFQRYGLALESFALESFTLPDALQKTLDERISMGMIGDMSRYAQYQTAASIPLAAQNEGGMAGIGASMAAGLGMGQMMMNSVAGGTNLQQNALPSTHSETPEGKLVRLKNLFDQGLITQTDFETAKTEILKQLIG